MFFTQNSGKILGPIARVLGYLMNWIFEGLDLIGIPNIGLAIILFTLVIYLCLTPLTIKQQKFSKLSAKMNPEIQAIQEKYKGKKDNETAMKMNEETKAVYEKYGVSPSGSCVQLLIQMPILFALYRVIYNIPAYVEKVKDAFEPFVSNFIDEISKSGVKAVDFIQNKENFASASQFSKQFTNEVFVNAGAEGHLEYVKNTFIDVLNKATTNEWHNIYATGNFENLKDQITNAAHTGVFDRLSKYNNFLGLSISNSPSYIIKDAFSNGQYLMIAGAILIPLLAALTQWINTKLMPQADTSKDNSQQNSMQASMKTMNLMMPVMSAVFCFTLPCGMGIYWIAGAVIRSVQQIVINKHLDKQNIDLIIEQNMEKAKKKREKKGVNASTLMNSANKNTRTITEKASTKTAEEKEASIKKVNEYYAKNKIKPGGIAAKAHMVKQYNENNDEQKNEE
ncbi:MAG: YidC/Oxa1 family membrane protein insertase [Lachnospiraceae bacterium]|nr:YidC/Oxa1 family membrane protein insertase [Lachnospiraceae bacterium]